MARKRPCDGMYMCPLINIESSPRAGERAEGLGFSTLTEKERRGQLALLWGVRHLAAERMYSDDPAPWVEGLVSQKHV
jgi:hypothetical protein